MVGAITIAVLILATCLLVIRASFKSNARNKAKVEEKPKQVQTIYTRKNERASVNQENKPSATRQDDENLMLNAFIMANAVSEEKEHKKDHSTPRHVSTHKVHHNTHETKSSSHQTSHRTSSSSSHSHHADTTHHHVDTTSHHSFDSHSHF